MLRSRRSATVGFGSVGGAIADQAIGQCVRAAIELGIGQAANAIADRNGFGVAVHGTLEQPDQAGVAWVGRRGAVGLEHRFQAELVGREQGRSREPGHWVARNGGQQAQIMLGQSLDRRRLVKGGAVLDAARDGVAARLQREGGCKFGDRQVGLGRHLDFEARDRWRRTGIGGLKQEGDPLERCAARGLARDVELAHQPVVGHVLMRQRFVQRRIQLGQQLRKAGLAVEPGCAGERG